jgi:phenylpropionate dioxygenase-like ring-hydroxylating dioxygenase large terminal subunit
MAEGESPKQAKTTRGAAGEAGPAAGFGRGFLHGLWYFAELSSALKPNGLKRYEIMGEPVLLGRNRAGEAFALRDICPHRAAPLSAGRLVGEGAAEAVQCPYHG